MDFAVNVFEKLLYLVASMPLPALLAMVIICMMLLVWSFDW